MLGQITNGKNLHLPDLNLREMGGLRCRSSPGPSGSAFIPKPYFDDSREAGGADRGARAARLLTSRRRSARGNRAASRRQVTMSQFYTSHRSFRSGPGDHAGAVRMRHPAVRFPASFPTRDSANGCCSFVVLGQVFTGVGLLRQQMLSCGQRLDELTGFQGSLTVDGFALFFNWIFLLAALIVAIVSYKYLEIEGEHHGEYYGADPARAMRHVLPGDRHRPGHAVHRTGADGAVLLRHGRISARPRSDRTKRP